MVVVPTTTPVVGADTAVGGGGVDERGAALAVEAGPPSKDEETVEGGTSDIVSN